MVLLIYAHPNTGGHCEKMLRESIALLKKQKISYDLIDLYKDEYDPVMHENEHYTAKGYEISKLTKKYRDLISKHDKLIFIYPIWWNSMPAIMKGFCDKVFGGRFAFRYTKMPLVWFPVPIGLLKGKRACVFTSTGARWWMASTFLGNRYKHIIIRDILGFCGIKAKIHTLHNCNGDSGLRIGEIKKLVKKGLKPILK